jgi:hypothetical protein
VVTGVPVGRPAPQPAAPFDVFTPVHRLEQDVPAPADAGYRQAYPDFGDSYQGDGFGASVGNGGAADGRYPGGDTDGGDDLTGLPRRVRQASLAPELRASRGAPADNPGSVAPASAASLSDMRNTLSAMQRGWQQGRSQTQRETEDGTADGE